MDFRKFARGWGVLLIVVSAVASTIVSCTEPTPVDSGKSLNLSSRSTTVGFGATSASLTVVAHSDWTLSIASGGDWITPSVRNGAANSTVKVTFTFDPNSGETARKATVSLKAADEDDPYIFTITQNAKSTLTGVNAWIHEQLSGWYYWNDAVKATAPPSEALAYDEFLAATINALPWADVQDTSNGEDPATIDGTWGRDNNGALTGRRTNIYSNITRVPVGTRTVRGAAGSMAPAFGFGIEPFRGGGTTDDNPQLMFLVLWVIPDSPADNAGLERGMWIYKYNGADIFWDQYKEISYQLYDTKNGYTMDISVDTNADGRLEEVSLRAVETKVTPIIHDDIITTGGGKKVAYLVYNGFERGDAESKGTFEFDNDLRESFGRFKSAGVTEMVLDLRYNGGGYVNTCSILTDLVADVKTTDVFAKLLRNDDIGDVFPSFDNPEILKFRGEANSLNLRKIYVLATENSASASEMVINSIRGVLGDAAVVHIGTFTDGKNVGMDLRETTIEGYKYEMWPITFKILNAKNFTDYAGGFEPDLYIDEFWDVTPNEGATGILHDFGPKERLLKAALDRIDGKNVRPDTRGARTRAAGDGTKQRVPSLEDPRRGGAKYIPQEQQ